MKSAVCEMLGIEFPLLAFSHCRDVVAAVSRAGGMGVFGAVRYSPEQLREELTELFESDPRMSTLNEPSSRES